VEVRDLAPILKNRYLHESDASFRRPLFTALAMSGHACAAPVLMAQIRSEGRFQDMALPSLMNMGAVAHAQAAARRMKQLASSDNMDDQHLFLTAAAKVKSNRFDDDIQRLFNAPDPDIARLAMRSSGQTGRAVFAGLLLQRLKEPAFADAAGAALVTLGDAAVEPLGSCLVSPAPLALCLAATRRLGEIGTVSAVSVLKQYLKSEEPLVLGAIGRALWWAEAPLKGTESSQALRNATRLFHAAAQGHAMVAGLSTVPDATLLRQALDRQIEALLGGAFIWLALRKRLFDIDLAPFLAIRGSGIGQSYLEELAHSLVPSSLRGLVDVLIDGVPREARLVRIMGAAKLGPVQAMDVLRQLAVGTPTQLPWTRVAALAAALNFHPDAAGFCAAVAKERGLAGDVARELLIRSDFKTGDSPMGLNTIEKILLLKSFELFKPVPDDVLAAYAPVIATASFVRGETIASEGTVGNCLYVLAKGDVTVQSKKHAARLIINTGIIDELSALSPAVREDTLIAASDCELLVVTHDDFESMIRSDPATSLGIVRVLSERLRKQ
jgi:Cyclic nucleotide-binding domain